VGRPVLSGGVMKHSTRTGRPQHMIRRIGRSFIGQAPPHSRKKPVSVICAMTCSPPPKLTSRRLSVFIDVASEVASRISSRFPRKVATSNVPGCTNSSPVAGFGHLPPAWTYRARSIPDTEKPICWRLIL
jgi:hypothetical protein